MKLKYLHRLLLGACVANFLAPTSSQGVLFQQDPRNPIPPGRAMVVEVEGSTGPGYAAGSDASDPRQRIRVGWQPDAEGRFRVQVNDDVRAALEAWLATPYENPHNPNPEGWVRFLSITGHLDDPQNDGGTAGWRVNRHFQPDAALAVLNDQTTLVLDYYRNNPI